VFGLVALVLVKARFHVVFPPKLEAFGGFELFFAAINFLLRPLARCGVECELKGRSISGFLKNMSEEF
jgi:hypothetical protein